MKEIKPIEKRRSRRGSITNIQVTINPEGVWGSQKGSITSNPWRVDMKQDDGGREGAGKG